jgi:Cu(I)/Ag(I) efflux system protein CusF
MGLLALTSIIAAPAIAQSADGGMKDRPGMQHSAPAEKTRQVVGVITTIDEKSGKVAIRHSPIPAVQWPAMTMTFRATPPTLLNGVRVGQSVIFDVRTKGMDAEVTSLRSR